MAIKNIVLLLILLIAVSLISSCVRRNITISPQYNTIIEERESSYIQEDFKNKAGDDRVYFAFDKAILSEDAKNTLRKQADWLRTHPSILATIEGHCDEIGTKEYNLVLGLKRAKAVGKFLIDHGIDNARLTMVSFGKERPEFLEHTKKAHQLNRRSITIIATDRGF